MTTTNITDSTHPFYLFNVVTLGNQKNPWIGQQCAMRFFYAIRVVRFSEKSTAISHALKAGVKKVNNWTNRNECFLWHTEHESSSPLLSHFVSSVDHFGSLKQQCSFNYCSKRQMIWPNSCASSINWIVIDNRTLLQSFGSYPKRRTWCGLPNSFFGLHIIIRYGMFKHSAMIFKFKRKFNANIKEMWP